MAGQPQRLARPWWYEDPARRHDLRYWTGTEWSEFVIDGPNRTPSIDPPTVVGATRSDVATPEETPLAASTNGDGAGATAEPGAAEATTDTASTAAGVVDADGETPSRTRRILLALLVALVGALLVYAVLGRGGDDRVDAASSTSSSSSATWDAAAPALLQQAEAGALVAEKGRLDVVNGSATGNADLSNIGAVECDQGEGELRKVRGVLLPVPQSSALSDDDALALESLLDRWIAVAHRCDAGSEFTGAQEAARLEAALAQL